MSGGGPQPSDRPGDGSGARRASVASPDATSAESAIQAEPAGEAVRRRRSLSTLLVGLLAGALIGATAITAQGNDLRPDRTSDMFQLAAQMERRNQELTDRASVLRADIDGLSAGEAAPSSADPDRTQAAAAAGLGAVVGPAVKVTLTDAPVDFAPPGVDGDLLVVHEQDIQHVVNALWTAGAEAMTIQGQRVTATTAVKCVGNTVVLHGIPYAPPYVITAIGDVADLEAGLAADRDVKIYRQYAQVYLLGYTQQRLDEVSMPGYAGPLPQQATVVR